METIRPLTIGDLKVKWPIIQGGMGVGISLSSLAGHVAKEGGIGIISAAQIGFREPDFAKDPMKANLRAMKTELQKAREIAQSGAVGFNIMVATKNYKEYVKEAVRCNADVIISGAGLPTDLPEYVKEDSHTKIAPIVSSKKAASVICKMWDRKYHRVPDFVVMEGPLAGGHLGFSLEHLQELGADSSQVSVSFQKKKYEEEIKEVLELLGEYRERYKKEIPLILAGGIYTHQDVCHALSLGACGVQVGTRFVTTLECDAPDAYKQEYIKVNEEDIVITKSPVGMPGRAIDNAFLKEIKDGKRPEWKHCYQCLEKCDKVNIPYCITQALIHAAAGDVDHALLFCGSNAYRAKHLETVEEVMKELTGVVVPADE